MEAYMDDLEKATVLFTLHASPVYYHIEIDKSNRDKTTFTSHRGLHKFSSMIF